MVKSLISIPVAKQAGKIRVAIGQRHVERLVAATPAPYHAALVQHSNRGPRLSAIPKLDCAIRLQPSSNARMCLGDYFGGLNRPGIPGDFKL
jgi:hypothetical protein